jgi:hypothetical protein
MNKSQINSKLIMLLIYVFPSKFSYRILLKSLLKRYKIFNVNLRTKYYKEIPNNEIEIIGYKKSKLQFKFNNKTKGTDILIYKKDYKPSKNLTSWERTWERMSLTYLIWKEQQLKTK